MAYTWDGFTNGFTCFRDGLKLCNYFTHSDQGLYRNGRLIFEKVKPEQRSLHFTMPEMRVADVKAIIESLPDVDSHPHEVAKK